MNDNSILYEEIYHNRELIREIRKILKQVNVDLRLLELQWGSVCLELEYIRTKIGNQ